MTHEQVPHVTGLSGGSAPQGTRHGGLFRSVDVGRHKDTSFPSGQILRAVPAALHRGIPSPPDPISRTSQPYRRNMEPCGWLTGWLAWLAATKIPREKRTRRASPAFPVPQPSNQDSREGPLRNMAVQRKSRVCARLQPRAPAPGNTGSAFQDGAASATASPDEPSPVSCSGDDGCKLAS